jgi:hypothetical protein
VITLIGWLLKSWLFGYILSRRFSGWLAYLAIGLFFAELLFGWLVGG